ncbi:MAG: hypothetical protein J6M18_03195 [Actinomycetaceae bacterium]|nr:hypothetical protein [Actinomycetaceae bacterium]
MSLSRKYIISFSLSFVLFAGVGLAVGNTLEKSDYSYADISHVNVQDESGAVGSNTEVKINENIHSTPTASLNINVDEGSETADDGLNLTPRPGLQGDNLTIIGDSLIVGATNGLQNTFPGVYIDGKIGRHMSEVHSIIQKIYSMGELRDYVVIGLATNGPVTRDDISKIMRIAEDRNVVFVTGYGPRRWIPESNNVLRAAAQEYSNIRLAQWDTVANASLVSSDGIHPVQKGTEEYTQEVIRALRSF